MQTETPAGNPARPRRAVIVLGLLLPCVVSVALLETGVRLFLERPGFLASSQEGAGSLLQEIEGSARLYGYRPGTERQLETAEGSIRVAINERGFRDAPWSGREIGGVLVAGDSFTAGWGVDQDEPYPQVLERLLADAEVGVVNTGVSGYSLRQIRTTTEELLPELEPRWVIVGVYASRASRIGNPYVVVDDELVVSDVAERIRVVPGGYVRPSWSGPLGGLERFCDRWLYSCSHLLRAVSSSARESSTPAEAVQPLLDELDLLRQSVEEAGSQLWIVQVLTQDEDGRIGGFEGRFAQHVASWCEDRSARCFDPGPLFERSTDGSLDMRLGADHHWSARAHALVARELAAALLEELRASGDSADEVSG